jgi:hypothetical protein
LHQANTRADDNPTYTLVYDRVPDNPLDDVLIIGAGGGNDVSVALARGAKHIDAVEIDPRLQELGEETHPDDPYGDPRVDVHIDDGRAYLEGTDNRYDLILFALPDSITLLPGQSSVRLESYLFTKEALEAAREHLKPDGAFSMYNYYREPWLLDRFAGTLEEVFGNRPCAETVLQTGLYAVLVDAPNPRAFTCDQTWSPSGTVPKVSTDDHPFPYLRTRSIPNLYLVTIGFILLASLLLVRVVAGRLRAMTGYLDLFFMGVAFLLLETQNVVKFALLFGTTWVVNAFVFLGLLLSVLVAVEVSRRVTFKRPARLYLFLLASLAVAFALPQSSLLSRPRVRAGLHRQPRVHAAVQERRFLDERVRREPHRGDGRRPARVRRVAHRLSLAADRRRRRVRRSLRRGEIAPAPIRRVRAGLTAWPRPRRRPVRPLIRVPLPASTRVGGRSTSWRSQSSPRRSCSPCAGC